MLFPEREHMKQYSAIFFKNVNLATHDMTKIEFFVRSQAYPSAYIYLSRNLSKDIYFKALLETFQSKNPALLKTFNETYKEKARIDDFRDLRSKLKTNKPAFYLLMIYTIREEYVQNKLSGQKAFRYWNVLFSLTERTYKEKAKSLENAALLKLASHFTFFKKHQKWLKKSRRIRKKLPIKTSKDATISMVLSGT
ncbi:MAG: hypothetical protein GY765_03005 [bacterium]|nr:hypothetical protein [bacterium]